MPMQHSKYLWAMIDEAKRYEIWKPVNRAKPHVSVHDGKMFGIRFNPIGRAANFIDQLKSEALLLNLVPISRGCQIALG